MLYILTMRSVSESGGQGRPSFIEEARRRQIVDTAIRTIADRGYSQTSLAEIARQAGISKGVISYHFEGKDELVEEILARLLREPAQYIKERVESGGGAMAQVLAYIRANFDFMKTHRNYYVALVDLWGTRAAPRGRNRFDAEAYEPSRHYLGRILESGTEQGEFRKVRTGVMASLIQAAIDGVMLQWVLNDRAVDLDAFRHEIEEMIRHHLEP